MKAYLMQRRRRRRHWLARLRRRKPGRGEKASKYQHHANNAAILSTSTDDRWNSENNMSAYAQWQPSAAAPASAGLSIYNMAINGNMKIICNQWPSYRRKAESYV